jgi:hypothetical protein
VIRLLLTLLALLTGLSAPSLAAEARVIGASEVAVEAGAGDVGLVTPRGVAAIPAVSPNSGARPCTVIMYRRAAVCVPAVQLRIDRAHE